MAMRVRILALAAVAAAVMMAAPAGAQTYDPRFPVCLQVFGPIPHFECRYFSFEQCRVTASGLSAQCIANPFASGSPARAHRHHHHAH
jgi:hypothetical protein